MKNLASLKMKMMIEEGGEGTHRQQEKEGAQDPRNEIDDPLLPEE